MRKTTLMTMTTAMLALGSIAHAQEPGAGQSGYHDWSGAYAGVVLGYGTGRSVFTDLDGYNAPGGKFGVGLSGGMAGLTLGYNLQDGPVVFGLEGELGYLDASGSGVQEAFAVVQDSFGFIQPSLYGSLAARLGFSIDKALVFARAGVAFTGANGRFEDACSLAPCGPGLLSATAEGINVGLTLGGGVEYALDEAWSAKIEYAYLGFGTRTATGVSSFGPVFSYDYDQPVHSLRVGLNYRF